MYPALAQSLTVGYPNKRMFEADEATRTRDIRHAKAESHVLQGVRESGRLDCAVEDGLDRGVRGVRSGGAHFAPRLIPLLTRVLDRDRLDSTRGEAGCSICAA